ncbi:MAG: helix-turn-helix transcriptional regulator [Oscillospiraceae bacterium]|nr:helix-turn-helix transcriptional regulator [Oscillospiraceae bacterium]
MRDIGKNIKTLRIQKDMTQDALAERLFVTRQTVSNYETGRSRPDIDMLLRIADVLEADIHVILYGPGIPADRRKELIRLAVCGGIVLVMGLIILLTADAVKDYYYNFVVGPMVLVRTLMLPAFFFLLGWSLVQGISVLLKAKRPAFKWATVLRWILLAITILWMIPVLTYTVPILVFDLMHLPVQIHLPPMIARIFLYAVIALQKYPYFLLFLGGGLWLCGLPTFKKPTSVE